MTMDHFALIFLESDQVLYTVFRSAGRVALPIACCLLVLGYQKTKSRRKYVIRLGAVGLISEVFWLFLYVKRQEACLKVIQDAYEASGSALKMEEWYQELPPETMMSYWNGMIPLFNVVFTLLACILMMKLFDLIKSKVGPMQVKKPLHNFACMMFYGLAIFGIVVLLVLVKADYSLMAPLLVANFYFFFDEKPTMILIMVFIIIFQALESPWMMIGMAVSVLLVWKYNGKLGYEKKPWVKWIFYVYYPLHLSVLVWIRYFDELCQIYFK